MLQQLRELALLWNYPFWTLGALGLAVLALGFFSAPLWAWWTAALLTLVLVSAPLWLLLLAALAAVVFSLEPLRRALVTRPVMALMKLLQFLPAISQTEREALEAGTVWADAELFSGKPDFERLSSEAYPDLSAEERAFLEGPVAEACRLTDDWQVFQARDLPPEVWRYLKEQRFFGLIIPKQYGGHGFSPSANSAVVKKLASRSGPLAITVMVPNSLGPAELLIHYGTQAQKDHYLPRLARGEEIPCFALTEPGAGSDAGALSSRGEVVRGEDGGLYLRLSWNKRYITLAAVSTVLGLAFKLSDPDNLLGRGRDLGITCALIPTRTPGVVLGKRHDPLGVPFYNCPTSGENVLVPIDAIIGGPEGAGKGWRMLMECLAAGRGISLPASSTAAALMSARVAGAYAAVRKQFGLAIGRFEGIQEPLARIAGNAYILEAARRYTNGGLDSGAKPAVVTAMAKYAFTEAARQSLNDAMDILGGAAISRGPRNLLANAYQGTPISITVEGANILTRTLMIFGQGAIRCHPYAYQEVKAMEADDAVAFDRAFWSHVRHVVENGCRTVVHSLTRGRFASYPLEGPTGPYYRRLAWASASFAFLADLAMASLGGDLKRREKVTGRFSDIFIWMYLGNAVLRRFEAEGAKQEDEPFLHWSMEHAFERMQAGFDGLYRNLPVPVLGWVLRHPVALWSRLNPLGRGPSDAQGAAVANALQRPGPQRDALTAGLYIPSDLSQHLAELERAFLLCHQADEVLGKLRSAVKAGKLQRGPLAAQLQAAVEAQLISRAEAERVAEAEKARDQVVQVDAFGLEEYRRTSAHPARAGSMEPGTSEAPRGAAAPAGQSWG